MWQVSAEEWRQSEGCCVALARQTDWSRPVRRLFARVGHRSEDSDSQLNAWYSFAVFSITVADCVTNVIHLCALYFVSRPPGRFLQNIHSLVSVSFDSFTGLWQTDDCCIFTEESWVQLPLWSSGQSSWLQIRRPGFDSRNYPKKK
jgi:hypothetical protein